MRENMKKQTHKTRTWNHIRSLYLLHFIFLLFLQLPCLAGDEMEEVKLDLGNLGTVMVPEGWFILEKGTDMIKLSSADRQSFGYYRKLENRSYNKTVEELEARAVELGLPNKIRTVDKKWLKKTGFDNGKFALGTTHLGLEAEKSDSNVSSESSFTRYYMVVLYEKGDDCYWLEAWTDSLPDDALLLNRLQRSWSLNKNEDD